MGEKEISEKMQDIMKRMKTRREELNMSYQTLSEKVGISKSTLQRYETGITKKVPADALEKIGKALGTHFGEDVSANEQKDISELLNRCLIKLEADSPLMFDGEALDDKTRGLLKASLENSIMLAKMISKNRG